MDFRILNWPRLFRPACGGWRRDGSIWPPVYDGSRSRMEAVWRSLHGTAKTSGPSSALGSRDLWYAVGEGEAQALMPVTTRKDRLCRADTVQQACLEARRVSLLTTGRCEPVSQEYAWAKYRFHPYQNRI